jgi:hypothetical protein
MSVDLGAGVLGEGSARQADCAGEPRPLGEIFARLGVELVHGAGRGDEQQRAARLDRIERLGEEIVVQHQPERAIGRVRLDDGLGEGRVADDER